MSLRQNKNVAIDLKSSDNISFSLVFTELFVTAETRKSVNKVRKHVSEASAYLRKQVRLARKQR